MGKDMRWFLVCMMMMVSVEVVIAMKKSWSCSHHCNMTMMVLALYPNPSLPPSFFAVLEEDGVLSVKHRDSTNVYARLGSKQSQPGAYAVRVSEGGFGIGMVDQSEPIWSSTK